MLIRTLMYVCLYTSPFRTQCRTSFCYAYIKLSAECLDDTCARLAMLHNGYSASLKKEKLSENCIIEEVQKLGGCEVFQR